MSPRHQARAVEDAVCSGHARFENGPVEKVTAEEDDAAVLQLRFVITAERGHLVAGREQLIDKMRSEKPGAPGDDRALWAHAFLPFRRDAAGTPSG